MSEIHGLLLEAGYQPWSSVTSTVYFAIADAFELLGESCSSLLINHLSEMHRIPKYIVLTRYDLLSKAISQVFGYGSEVFLHEIRRNLLAAFHATATRQSLLLTLSATRTERRRSSSSMH